MVNARSERPLCCPPHMPQEIGDVCFGSGLGPSSKRANEVGAAPGSSTFGPQPRTRCLPHPSLQTRPTPPVHWEGGPSVRPGSASCAPRLLSCPPGAHRAAAGRLPQLRPSLHSQQVRSEAWLFILCLHALLGRPSRRPVRSSPDHVVSLSPTAGSAPRGCSPLLTWRRPSPPGTSTSASPAAW